MRRATGSLRVRAAVQTQLDVDQFVQHSQQTRASILEVKLTRLRCLLLTPVPRLCQALVVLTSFQSLSSLLTLLHAETSP